MDACWSLFVWETNEAQDRFRKFFEARKVIVRRSPSEDLVQACRRCWPDRRGGALFALKVGDATTINVARRLATGFPNSPCDWLVSLAPEIGVVVCRPKGRRLSNAYDFILKAAGIWSSSAQAPPVECCSEECV